MGAPGYFQKNTASTRQKPGVFNLKTPVLTPAFFEKRCVFSSWAIFWRLHMQVFIKHQLHAYTFIVLLKVCPDVDLIPKFSYCGCFCTVFVQSCFQHAQLTFEACNWNKNTNNKLERDTVQRICNTKLAFDMSFVFVILRIQLLLHVYKTSSFKVPIAWIGMVTGVGTD